MKLVWMSDLHMDFVSPSVWNKFVQDVNGHNPDHVFITGDISNGLRLKEDIKKLSEFKGQVHFVLGNHDCYESSISKSKEIAGLSNSYINNYTLVSNDTVFIGDDGWYDGRAGNINGGVLLNDFFKIKELYGVGHGFNFISPELKELIYGLGGQVAVSAEKKLQEALNTDAKNIIFLTHVPPFEEAAWHRGEKCEESFLPFFCNNQVGQVLIEGMENSDKNLLVLCGHTHGSGEYNPLPNLKVLTAGAKYRFPSIEKIWEI